jgi:hypothetical protein
MITQILPEQIEQVVQDGQFKYIKLTGADLKEYGGWNKTPAELKKKIQSIREHIQKLPAGNYFLHFKINPRGDEWKYIYQKESLSQNGSPAAPVIIQAPGSQLEKFQTIDEWKRQELRIKDLEKELELLKFRNEIKEQLNEKPEENPIQGFAANILPQFVPLFDRYMDLQDRKIQAQVIQSKQLTQATAVNKSPAVKPFRPVPDVNSDMWESYLDYLDNLSDERFSREIFYLKTKQPEIYKAVNDAFTDEE